MLVYRFAVISVDLRQETGRHRQMFADARSLVLRPQQCAVFHDGVPDVPLVQYLANHRAFCLGVGEDVDEPAVVLRSYERVLDAAPLERLLHVVLVVGADGGHHGPQALLAGLFHEPLGRVDAHHVRDHGGHDDDLEGLLREHLGDDVGERVRHGVHDGGGHLRAVDGQDGLDGRDDDVDHLYRHEYRKVKGQILLDVHAFRFSFPLYFFQCLPIADTHSLGSRRVGHPVLGNWTKKKGNRTSRMRRRFPWEGKELMPAESCTGGPSPYHGIDVDIRPQRALT